MLMRSGGPGSSLSRRGVLLAGTALGLLGAGALSGCTEQAPTAPAPLEPDEPAVNRAIAAARALHADAVTLAAAQPPLATLVRRVAEVHAQHLVALGAPLDPTPTASSSAGVSPSAGSSPSVGSSSAAGAAAGASPSTGAAVPVTAARQATAERTGAREALRDGLAATPAFAVLLCRIAAARVVNADLISTATGATPSGVLKPAAPQAITPSATSPAPPGTTTAPPPGSAPASPGATTPPPGSSRATAAPGSTPASAGATTTLPAGPAPASGPASASAGISTAPPTGPAPASTAAATPSPAGSVRASTGATPAPPVGTASPTPDLQTTAPDPADLTAPDSPTSIALDRLLAGEHAAVFAYPVIIARAGGARRGLARELWQAHRSERDGLTSLLVTAGFSPTPAEAAYDVGTPPATPAKAAALAVRVERGLAALATDLLAAATAGAADRVLGAGHLVVAARRTATWSARPIPFPGLITRAPTPTSTGTPTPTP